MMNWEIGKSPDEPNSCKPGTVLTLRSISQFQLFKILQMSATEQHLKRIQEKLQQLLKHMLYCKKKTAS